MFGSDDDALDERSSTKYDLLGSEQHKGLVALDERGPFGYDDILIDVLLDEKTRTRGIGKRRSIGLVYLRISRVEREMNGVSRLMPMCLHSSHPLHRELQQHGN
jgi:hypothetical protein